MMELSPPCEVFKNCSNLAVAMPLEGQKKLEAPMGHPLVVRWLRLLAPNAGGRGSILGSGNLISHAATKTQCRKKRKKKNPNIKKNKLEVLEEGDMAWHVGRTPWEQAQVSRWTAERVWGPGGKCHYWGQGGAHKQKAWGDLLVH